MTGKTSNGRKGRFDVIVVGAGPAGSTAARHCALAGLKTLVLEKQTMPRYKPCAGGFSLAAARELDFELPEGLIERKCRGLRVHYRTIEREVRLPETTALMVIRSSFDAHLARKAEEAGAALRDHTPCTGVSVEREGVSVETDGEVFTTDVVIGADGFFSRVRRSLHLRFEPDEIRTCALAEVPLTPDEIDRRFGDLVLIHYGYLSKGYAWIFPKKNHLSVGIGGACNRSGEVPEALRSFLSCHGLPTDVPIRGCFIPVSQWRTDLFFDRVLLTGDAAGLVDSFSGEGIKYAITSGRLAAQTVIQAHGRGDFSTGLLQEYQSRLMATDGRELKRSNHVTDRLFSYENLLLGAVVWNVEALERYLMIVRGDSSFSEYMSWLKRRLPRYLLKRVLHFR